MHEQETGSGMALDESGDVHGVGVTYDPGAQVCLHRDVHFGSQFADVIHHVISERQAFRFVWVGFSPGLFGKLCIGRIK